MTAYAGTVPNWPLVADLDGDGRAEIVVADSGPLDMKNDYRGARMLDGPTGRPRWTRPMSPQTIADDGLIDIIEAPDLDGDGTRDLAAAVLVIGSLFRLGWEPVAWIAGSSLIASVIIAGAWLWSDRRIMPAIERYDRSHAPLTLLLGCYGVSVLVVAGGLLRGIVRALRRHRARPAGPVDVGRARRTMSTDAA